MTTPAQWEVDLAVPDLTEIEQDASQGGGPNVFGSWRIVQAVNAATHYARCIECGEDHLTMRYITSLVCVRCRWRLGEGNTTRLPMTNRAVTWSYSEWLKREHGRWPYSTYRWYLEELSGIRAEPLELSGLRLKSEWEDPFEPDGKWKD